MVNRARFFQRETVFLEKSTSNFFDFGQHSIVGGLLRRSAVDSQRS